MFSTCEVCQRVLSLRSNGCPFPLPCRLALSFEGAVVFGMSSSVTSVCILRFPRAFVMHGPGASYPPLRVLWRTATLILGLTSWPFPLWFSLLPLVVVIVMFFRHECEVRRRCLDSAALGPISGPWWLPGR